MSTQLTLDWQEHTIKTYEAKHGGVYASVAQFDQAWIGRIWSAANGDPLFTDYFTSPALAMGSLTLAIEDYTAVQA